MRLAHTFRPIIQKHFVKLILLRLIEGKRSLRCHFLKKLVMEEEKLITYNKLRPYRFSPVLIMTKFF